MKEVVYDRFSLFVKPAQEKSPDLTLVLFLLCVRADGDGLGLFITDLIAKCETDAADSGAGSSKNTRRAQNVAMAQGCSFRR